MKALCCAMALSLVACAMPATTVRTPDSRPSLAVVGAPLGSQLFVDGNPMGDAALYDGEPTILLVEPGSHVVDLRDGHGRVLFQQTVFVDGETKTIQVH
jgi:hypothetical protein